MSNIPTITKQINNHLHHHQLINAHLQLLQALKKADRTLQDVSAFNNQAIRLIKTNQLNQLN